MQRKIDRHFFRYNGLCIILNAKASHKLLVNLLDLTESMVGFTRIWGTPKESPKTLISDGEHFALEDEKRFWNLKIEELCLSMQHFGMRDKPGFLQRLSKAVNETPSGHDVANLSELEGIPEADEEVVVKSVNGKNFSLPGKSVRKTWKGKYTLSEWPEVAHALTCMNAKEKAKIRGMEIPQLKDFVANEWPARMDVIFTPGRDGVMKATLQERVINMLRLDLGELKALTEHPDDTDHFNRIVDYLDRVRPDLYRR